MAVAGGAIETVGAVHEADAAADAAELQADNLDELSEEGGYYDQVLEALQTELDDIEADREAAALNLQMTEKELTGQIGVSKLEEGAAVAGLTAQKVGQAVGALETARTGAEATASVAAQAGAGGVSVGSGSVLRTAAGVNRAIGRRVALANVQIGATVKAITTTREAGALQREVLQNNITRARLNYADQLRALDTREAQVTAQTTLTEFQQETGGEQADLLREEAEWIQEYGIPLTIAGGILGGVGTVIGGLTRLAGFGAEPTPMSTGYAPGQSVAPSGYDPVTAQTMLGYGMAGGGTNALSTGSY